MNELIELRRNEAVTTSLQIAEHFGKRHNNVVAKISEIVARNEATQKMFKESTYKAEDNQLHRMFYINRDGFAFLVMGFTGKKADAWKLKYIEAFNKMELLLAERATATWLEERRTGILTRKEETSVIQQLIEYAKEQGSEHSEKLYMVYTKLANTMAGVSDRDLAPIHKLCELNLIENIILNQIANGMEAGQNYKEIYQLCKKQIETFKYVAYLETKVG